MKENEEGKNLYDKNLGFGEAPINLRIKINADGTEE